MTGHAVTRVRKLAARIDAATPPHRDRTVDALRALAIAGVILGHWLVTALVLSHGRAGTTVQDKSPLAAMPALTPVSWIFQTLAIFFLVGGYAAARSYRGGYPAWLRQRLVRLSRPVAALTAVWTLLATGLYLGGISGVDPAHRAHAGARPAVVPGSVRGADRADPAGRGAGAPPRRLGGMDPPVRRRGRRPGAVRPRRAVVGGLDQRAGRLAGALPARYRVGARRRSAAGRSRP